MTRSFFTVGLLLLLVSCNPKPEDCPTAIDKPLSTSLEKQDATPPTTTGCTPTENPDDPGSDPGDEPTGDVPPEAQDFDINVSLTNFDANDEIKVRKAFDIIKKVVASKEFKTRVENFTYGGKKTFVDNDSFSNTDIYQKLLDGSEDLVPGMDHQMDLDLELYYSSRSTVGYTYATGIRIWMNTKFFDAYTPCEVAGNVFHEWTHKLGFTHASSYSLSRDSSVPYAIGYLVEELGKKYE
jgi:hypothetical protein